MSYLMREDVRNCKRLQNPVSLAHCIPLPISALVSPHLPLTPLTSYTLDYSSMRNNTDPDRLHLTCVRLFAWTKSPEACIR